MCKLFNEMDDPQSTVGCDSDNFMDTLGSLSLLPGSVGLGDLGINVRLKLGLIQKQILYL